MSMKYYKNPVDNSLWAYESNGSQDAYIKPGLVGITNADFAAAQAAIVAAATPKVPQVVTPFQAKAALLQAGLLDTVKAAIASAPAITQLAWSDATEFTRDSPTIATMAGALGLTSAQVDALFVAASAIQA